MAIKRRPIDWLNENSRSRLVQVGNSERVSIDDIEPNDMNFYNTEDVTSLKASIYLDGLLQALVININHNPDGKKYRVISGHRRLKACKELVSEGNEKFRYIPAEIRDITDSDKERCMLIETNSTSRKISNYEKVRQYMELKEAFTERKRRKEFKGKTIDYVAETIGVSPAQAGNYNLIGTRLISPLMYMFRDGRITMELALEAVKKLSEEEQEELALESSETGTFTKADIDRIISKRVIPGQQSLADNNISDSDNENDCFDNGIPDIDNVPDNDGSAGDGDGKATVTECGNPVSDCVEENVPVTGTSGVDSTGVEKVGESSESDKKSSESMIDEGGIGSTNIVDGGINLVDNGAGENVPVTGTSDGEKPYGLDTVEDLIGQYEGLVKHPVSNKINRKNRCVLDALYLLRNRMKREVS